MNYAITQRTTASDISVLNQSFIWMCIGLIVTAFSSLFVASNQSLFTAIYSNNIIFFGLIIIQLALVLFLSLRITSMSFGAALFSFFVYSALNGITLSSIFLIYTGVSIASAFFVSAAVFGVMAFYGYTTNRDLTTIGNLALMVLLGIIIASLINLFLHNDLFGFILSCLSVLIFTGLTAYDTQKIKQLTYTNQNQNLGVLGALTLYLDFINIFLNLLRIFGRRRDE